jgi:hypothetical protein
MWRARRYIHTKYYRMQIICIKNWYYFLSFQYLSTRLFKVSIDWNNALLIKLKRIKCLKIAIEQFMFFTEIKFSHKTLFYCCNELKTISSFEHISLRKSNPIPYCKSPPTKTSFRVVIRENNRLIRSILCGWPLSLMVCILNYQLVEGSRVSLRKTWCLLVFN